MRGPAPGRAVPVRLRAERHPPAGRAAPAGGGAQRPHPADRPAVHGRRGQAQEGPSVCGATECKAIVS